MTSHQQTLESAIPDLRNVSLDQLAELRDSALANSIALHKQRLQHLRGVHSKHLMLLYILAEEAGQIDPSAPEIVAFRAGRKLLATVQEADPDAVTWLFSLPHIGGWEHDCLVRRSRELSQDFGYLAAAAAVAIRARVKFEIGVPVSDGRVILPGLGCFQGTGQSSWVLLRCDDEHLAFVADTITPYVPLRPEDGSGEQIQQWRGISVAQGLPAGREWMVLLETADHYLDRFALPMSGAPTAAEVTPLTARSNTDLDSATTPAAFGAIATIRPRDPVIMAEILVHEFEHLKLCGLLDVTPLMTPCTETVYAPRRPDPRPAGGLLQGMYAHLGFARFWNAQRQVEAEPDDRVSARGAALQPELPGIRIEEGKRKVNSTVHSRLLSMR